MRNVDPFVEAGMEPTGKPEVMFNSGIEIVRVGEFDATVERTAKVTLTSQSAVWFASVACVWPTLEISRDVSSMKTLPVDARRGCEAGSEWVTWLLASLDSVIRYAGLNIPLGTNAGPYKW